MRWRWPPENSCGYLRPSAGVRRTWRRRSPTWFSRSALSFASPKARIGSGTVSNTPPRGLGVALGAWKDNRQRRGGGAEAAARPRPRHVVAVELDRARGRRIEADDQ